MIRVGSFPYLNVAPFMWGSERWEVALLTCVPHQFGRLARAGQADAGPMSVVDWFAQEAEFEPVGDFGIAADGAAQSVLLFSRRPIDSLDGAVVGLTTESSTSVILIRLILERRYGVRPHAYEPGGEGDAWLVIGDGALVERRRADAPHVYDLGSEWRAWQGLPFVFARWVVRRALPGEQKRHLAQLLEASFSSAMANLEAVARARAGHAGLDATSIAAYLRTFRYRLGPAEEAGLARFRDMLASAPGLPGRDASAV
ncbi:MAG: menaquinone biosynthesis protein [Armatimonadetes bacterium]|nr:menaquinone biosynthesis protein [Armatimonadota bacterium]